MKLGDRVLNGILRLRIPIQSGGKDVGIGLEGLLGWLHSPP